MKPLAFILICLALASPLKAEEGIKGTDLYTACKGAPRDQVQCRIWIFGFANGLELAQIARNENRTFMCLPEDLTNLQVSLIVEKFMGDHPEVLHDSAITVAATALGLAFPCPGSNR
jgi:Rap1a immunity proteins